MSADDFLLRDLVSSLHDDEEDEDNDGEGDGETVKRQFALDDVTIDVHGGDIFKLPLDSVISLHVTVSLVPSVILQFNDRPSDEAGDKSRVSQGCILLLSTIDISTISPLVKFKDVSSSFFSLLQYVTRHCTDGILDSETIVESTVIDDESVCCSCVTQALVSL